MTKKFKHWQRASLGELGSTLSFTTSLNREHLSPEKQGKAVLHFMQIARDYTLPYLKKPLSYSSKLSARAKALPYQAIAFPAVADASNTPVRRALINLSKQPVYPGRDIFAFILAPEKEELLLPEFINWLIYAQPQRLKDVQQRTGGTISHLRRQEINDILIDYPSLDEQKKLVQLYNTQAQLIEDYAALIEYTTLQIKALKQRHFLSRAPLPIRLAIANGENNLADPKHPGWSWHSVESLASAISTGKEDQELKLEDLSPDPTSATPYPYYTRGQDVRYTDRANYAGPCILYANDGYNVGVSHYVPEGKLFSSYARLILIRGFNLAVVPRYLAYALDHFSKYEELQGAGGFPLASLQKMAVALPSLVQQSEFTQLLESLELTLKVHKKLHAKALLQFAAILNFTLEPYKKA
ncbi:hypothetical protein CJP74_05530 [Psittacicella melopsittaci]|uniref:Restriction endonuclease subunit S n=1 Tax=Psittacicella melopsittaci TaxID=2028576 RepID=A0A3A1Y7J4_9GAMM|nr:restriction endonuclease subunit S [Psittacicella melopsittaci]RIY32107.1 hypothetical protein CJP74_05530 [Psittacicella melopsittaci]